MSESGSSRAPHSPESSQAGLALLLHQTTLERDDARRALQDYKLRAERAEHILASLTDSSPNASSPNPRLRSPNSVSSLLMETQSQLDTATSALRASEARFRAIFEAWDGYDKWLLEVGRRESDARIGVRNMLVSLCDSSPHTHDVTPALVNPFPTLPPPPRVHVGDPERGRDAKRIKGEGTSTAGLSEERYILQHHHRPDLPGPGPSLHRSRHSITNQTLTLPPIQSQRILYGGDQVPQTQTQAPSTYSPNIHFVHHTSSSSSSNATPARPSSVTVTGKKRKAPSSDPGRHGQDISDDERSINEMILDAIPQTPASTTPTPQQTQQTIFAPPIVGPPSAHQGAKRSRTSEPGESIQTPGPPRTYPAMNEHGQRTCRQCGQAGRYKDSKCVEKWGPGPLGPGTVCDRCRKKTKRVERRAGADAAVIPGTMSVVTVRVAKERPVSGGFEMMGPPPSQRMGGGSGSGRASVTPSPPMAHAQAQAQAKPRTQTESGPSHSHSHSHSQSHSHSDAEGEDASGSVSGDTDVEAEESHYSAPPHPTGTSSSLPLPLSSNRRVFSRGASPEEREGGRTPRPGPNGHHDRDEEEGRQS